MEFAVFALLLSASLCLLLPPSLAHLKCCKNSDSANWSVVKCDVTNNETACLAQYRLYNGVPVPSFFGCHTPKMRCSQNCTPTEGQDNDFSCCCSSDLCNGAAINHTHGAPGSLGCEAKGCHHHCIEHEGQAECYCNGGYTLAADGVTCVDLDECAHNNGGCEVNCHNENGTGYHCSCHDYQMVKDDYRCENYSGLVCWSQTCNSTHCSPKTKSYCNSDSDNSLSTPHCQATYKYDKDTYYQVRLLSCFSGEFSCAQGGCTLRSFGSSPIYHCCCDGHLCNGNVTLPPLTQT